MSFPQFVFLYWITQAILILSVFKMLLPHLIAHFQFSLLPSPILWDMTSPQDQLTPFPDMGDEAVVFSIHSMIYVVEAMDWPKYALVCGKFPEPLNGKHNW